jgi:hypothetical protein
VSNGPDDRNAGAGGRKSFAVHPNSAAARSWGKTSWRSALTDHEARPRTVSGRRPVYTSNEEARSVPCPVCSAQLGRYCIGKRGLRQSAHAARHAAALQAGALPATRKRAGQRNRRARDKR